MIHSNTIYIAIHKLSFTIPGKNLQFASNGYQHLLHYTNDFKLQDIVRHYDLLNSENEREILDVLKWMYVSPSNGDTSILLKELNRLDFESKLEAPMYRFLEYLEISYIQPVYVYFLDDMGISLNETGKDICDCVCFINLFFFPR